MSISISDVQNIRKVSLLLFSVGPPKFPRSKFCKFNVGRAHGHKIKKRTCAPSNSCADARAWSRPWILLLNSYAGILKAPKTSGFGSIRCVDLKNCEIKNYSVVKMLLEKMQATGPMIFFWNSCTWKTTSLVWILSFETTWLVMYSYIIMFITIFSSAY